MTLVALLVCGCSQTQQAPKKTPQVVTVGGLKISDSLASVKAKYPRAEYPATGFGRINFPTGPLISCDFHDGKVKMVYGLKLEVDNQEVSLGDPLSRVLEILGAPTEKYRDKNSSPDAGFLLEYPKFSLTVGTDTRLRVIHNFFLKQ